MFLKTAKKGELYIWQKKDMRISTAVRLVASALATISITCCDPMENGPSRAETESGITDDHLDGGTQKRHLYISGVSFPEGYDWRRDTAFGKVACNIFLIRDGEVVCNVPAGINGSADAAPDRHHIISGHLYTEHHEPSQTIIQRDGKEILRYRGDETMRGMLLEQGKLLTLGQNRYGHGFALRRNGKVLFSSDDGELLGSYSDKAYAESGALYDDDGTACFSYFSTREGRRSWHFVDGEEESLLDSDGLATVYDMRSMMGDHYAVAQLKGGKAPVLLGSGQASDLSEGLISSVSNDYRLGAFDGRIFIVGEHKPYGTGTTGFWDEDGLITKIANDCRAFRYENGQFDYLKTSAGKVLSMTFKGQTSNIPGDWRLMTPQCLCWTGDGPVLALSDLWGRQHPAIWKNGSFTEVNVNGFLTGVGTGN